MTFKPYSKRSNPCPICEGGSDCRYDAEGKLILCHGNIDFDPNHANWHYLGASKDNVWGKFVPRQERSDFDPDKARQARIDRQLKLEAEKSRQAKEALGVEDRDKAIRSLSRHFGLSSNHQKDLHRRGLTDNQIERGLFFTVTYGEAVPFGIPKNLPGVKDGKLSNRSGLACVVFDGHGRAIGYQVRIDATDENKYRWALGEKSSHLSNGELPVTLVKGNPRSRDLWLTEGILKPFVASAKHGINCLGAAAGNFSGSPTQVKEAIKTYDRLIIAIDAGDMANRHVLKRWNDQISFLKSFGLPILIGDWGQGNDKALDDIDEIGNLNAIAYRDPSDFFGSDTKKGKGKLENFIDWVRNVSPLNRPKRETPKGFKLPKPETTYKRVARIDQWITTSAEVKNLLACDVTGDGKTFDAGRLNPSMFQAKGIDIERIIYVTSDPRNASTETFKDWDLLSGRHNGLVVNPLGEIRRRKKTDLGASYEQPNCSRCGVMEVLASKNIPNHSDKKQLCGGCPNFEPCNGGTGPGYGYLKQRSDALSSDRIIAHPSSLPSPEDFDYSKTLIIVDEWDKVISNKKDVKSTIKDVNEVIAHLAINAPVLFGEYRELLTRLLYLMGNDGKGYQHNRYGFTGQELRDYLVPLIPKGVNTAALREALTPDLSFLNPISEYGESIENLPREARKLFSDKDAKLAEKANETVLKQWFPEFLEVLLGLSDGYVNLAYGEMTISSCDNYLLDILRKSAKNILLSATGAEETFTQLFSDQTYKVVGTDNELIPENIVFTQITDVGRLGKQRGKNQAKRLEAIKAMAREKYGDNLAVMDFKAHSQDGDLHHFTHSQGTNLVAGKQALLICGTPCQNLEALKHEFSHLHKRWPGEDDQTFKIFVHCKILKTYAQTIGRLRANRQLDKVFEVILVTDYDLSELIPEIQLVKIKASEFSPNAEDKREKFTRLSLDAIAHLKDQGRKVSPAAVANLAGYCRSYVQRFWKLLQMLIDTNKANVADFTPSVDAQNEVKFLASEVLPQANDDAVLAFFDDVLKAYPENLWVDFWEAIPTAVQSKILTASLAVSLKLAPE